MGIFDQFLSARILDSYPQLYRIGQRDTFYNNRIFISSIATSLVHSLTIFYFWRWIFGESVINQDGHSADLWVFGSMVFATDLISVTLKATLLINSWVTITAYVLFGSLAAFICIFPIYAVVGPSLRISPELFNINHALFTSLVFWLGLILVPVIVNLRDFAWK
jgi:phospholipid-transporting ATPase